MRKLNKEEIEEIKELRKEGLSYSEIAEKFNISPDLARYHCMTDEQKKKRQEKQNKTFRSKSAEERRKIYKKRNAYIKQYLNRRYKEDEEFRNKIRERQRKC